MCTLTVFLQGITCSSNDEKRVRMESGKTCLNICFIDIKMSFTEHNTSGTYHLELNETRCQFLELTIYYRDFKPKCSVWFIRESNYFRFSCTWTTYEPDGKVCFLNGNHTLKETFYSDIPSYQVDSTNTFSTSINLF